jgi:hypothetical protein
MKPSSTKKPLGSPEDITIEQLEQMAENPEYEDNRDLIHSVLSGEEVGMTVEQLKNSIWLGERFDELESMLQNGTQPNPYKLRQLMKAVGQRVDYLEVIFEQLDVPLVRRYFEILSDDYGRKPYIIPYTEISDDSLAIYLEFEMLDSAEDKEAFILDLFKKPPLKSTISLLTTHLKRHPEFLGRLLTSHPSLMGYFQALVQRLDSGNMPHIVLKYLLFGPKRRKLIESCISKDGRFYARPRVIKQIRKQDNHFFDRQNFKTVNQFL